VPVNFRSGFKVGARQTRRKSLVRMDVVHVDDMYHPTTSLNLGIQSRMPFGITGLHAYTFAIVLVNLLLPGSSGANLVWASEHDQSLHRSWCYNYFRKWGPLPPRCMAQIAVLTSEVAG